MFEVGRLIARIQLEGAATFGRDLQQVGHEFSKLDEKGREATTRLGRGLALVGTAILTLAAIAVAKFASFDKAMSEVISVTGAAADEQDRLREAALDAGAVTVYTAEEAARAQAELARAGVNTTNILGGGLTGALALAAAGQLEVADAAEIAATAMTQFRLSGDQVPHLADLLAASANKAQGGVTDMGLALKQSGLVAAQMGLNVEETIGTLTAFASAGLLGSDAGTSFRTMLLALATPTKQQTALMREYGIEAYKAGEFVGIASLAEQLRAGKLGQATQAERDYALGIIFGSDAIRAANILYNQGAAGINEWTDAVNDAGAATRMASVLQDNLAGDVEKLGGALDSALIRTGEGANGVLRDMTQWITGLVDGYGNLDPAVQQYILTAGIALGATLLLGGGMLLTIPKIVEFRIALATLNTQVPALGAALGKVGAFLSGPWGVALAAALLGVSLLTDYVDSLKASNDELTASLTSTKTSAEDIYATFRKGEGIIRFDDGSLEDLNDMLAVMGTNPGLFSTFFAPTAVNQARGTLKKIGEELGTLSKSDLPSAQSAFRKFADETDGSNFSLLALLNNMPEYRAALVAQATELGTYQETMSDAQKDQVLLDLAMGDTARTGEYVAGTYSDMSYEAEGATLSIEELIDALNKQNGVNLSAAEANLRYQDQLGRTAEAAANARAGVEGFGLGLDLSTQHGRDNYGMLLDLAKAGQDVAQANLDAGGTAAQYRDELVNSRQAWIDQAIALGATADEAQALADKIYAIPSEKEIQIIAETANAASMVDGFITRYDGRRIKVYVDAASGDAVYSNGPGVVAFRANGGIDYYGNGGVRESHIAQIQRAGTTRVWNEPETGGEVYIPLADSKRARSLAILEETARMFGYELLEAGKSRATSTAGSSSGGGSPSQEVNETIQLVVDGKILTSVVRKYLRSLG